MTLSTIPPARARVIVRASQALARGDMPAFDSLLAALTLTRGGGT